MILMGLYPTILPTNYYGGSYGSLEGDVDIILPSGDVYQHIIMVIVVRDLMITYLCTGM